MSALHTALLREQKDKPPTGTTLAKPCLTKDLNPKSTKDHRSLIRKEPSKKRGWKFGTETSPARETAGRNRFVRGVGDCALTRETPPRTHEFGQNGPADNSWCWCGREATGTAACGWQGAWSFLRKLHRPLPSDPQLCSLCMLERAENVCRCQTLHASAFP